MSVSPDPPLATTLMSNLYSIRNITPRDDPSMARIIRTVMPEFDAGGPGFAIHDPEVDAMHAAYDKPRSIYFVVEHRGDVMGGAGIGPLAGAEDTICELRKMYFLPALRGLGAGRALIRRCLEAARERGYSQCYIETLRGMDSARALYLKSGFEPIPERMGRTGHFGCNLFFIRDL